MNNTVLDLSGKKLTKLPSLPDNLEKLYCSNNQLTYLISYGEKLPPNLKILECNGNKLIELPPLPDDLEELYCSNNQLSQLPILPPNLKILQCSRNELSKLPILPEKLKIIECNGNKLKSNLPPLPKDLEELYCSRNKLSSLQERIRMKNSSRYFSLPLPEKLKILDCNENSLHELPPLPINLEQLNCSNNGIDKLSPLPPNLKQLNCSDTYVTELPPLPLDLKIFDCSRCRELTKLPPLPHNLKELNATSSPIKNFKFQPFMQPVNITPSFNRFSINITNMDMTTSQLYKHILQDRLSSNPNIKDTSLTQQGYGNSTWQEVLRGLDRHIRDLDKLNLNFLSRPVFNENGSMIDVAGNRIGNAGVLFISKEENPDGQTKLLDPHLVKNIGSYFGGKKTKKNKIKPIKQNKNKNKNKNKKTWRKL
jgi:Leucine-rich repeat (LRR) protein